MEGSENKQPDERAAFEALQSEFEQAYRAFVGAFDTPQMRRMLSNEYADDARKRLRDFAENFARATQQAAKGDVRAAGEPKCFAADGKTHVYPVTGLGLVVKAGNFNALYGERATTPFPVAGSAGQAPHSAAQVISDLLFALTERRAKNVIRSEDAYVDAARAFLCRPKIPEELHPDTKDLVRRFASALAEKLLLAQQKYGYSTNWARAGWADECRSELLKHVHKGDPRDVAAYCAFLWHHEESTSRATTPTLADLHKELNKITWMGSDDGWDRAIEAVRARIIEMLSEGK